MPFDTILRPDNRLLNWSTSDFSLYGAQPDATSVSVKAVDIPVVSQPDVAGEETAPAPSATHTTVAPVIPGEEAGERPAEVDAPSGASTGTNADPSPDDANTAPPLAAQGGSTAFDLIAQPATITHIAPDGSPPPASVQATTAPLPDVTAPLAVATAGLSGVTTQLAQTDALVHGITDTVASEADTAANVLDGTIGTAANTLNTATSVVEGTVANTVDDALTGVLDLNGGLTDVLAGVAGSDLTDAVGQAPTLDIDQVIFGGADPVGGITTLVGMVQTSELFTIGQGSVPAAPDATGSIVDDLTDDATAVAPLLGEDAPDDLIPHTDLHLGL